MINILPKQKLIKYTPTELAKKNSQAIFTVQINDDQIRCAIVKRENVRCINVLCSVRITRGKIIIYI